MKLIIQRLLCKLNLKHKWNYSSTNCWPMYRKCLCCKKCQYFDDLSREYCGDGNEFKETSV